jgi:predicted dehydrogenase
MLRVGVIGCGYWGPNVIRNFIANSKTAVRQCADLKDARLQTIKRRYPSINTTNFYKDIIKDTAIDLVAICTPVNSHYEIAREALQSGKHVLIEKPMTARSDQAEDLINLAEQKGLRIFVDHTFVYTGVVRKMKSLIENNELGDLYYYNSTRFNLGLLQQDVNVLWDLAPHDISIMNYLTNRRPVSVVATGSDHFGHGFEDVAYLTLYFSDNFIAHIQANWMSPVKIRQTLIGGSKKMLVWDDNKATEKLYIYDKGIEVVKSADEVYKLLVQYRTGDMHCPLVDPTEALTVEVDHIVDCLEKGTPSIADGKAGWLVVRVLEAAHESIKKRGKEISI